MLLTLWIILFSFLHYTFGQWCGDGYAYSCGTSCGCGCGRDENEYTCKKQCCQQNRVPCPAGQYNNDVNSRWCTGCPENFFCPSGTKDPIYCGSGCTSAGSSGSISDCMCASNTASSSQTPSASSSASVTISSSVSGQATTSSTKSSFPTSSGRVMCTPGSFSYSGFEPCTPCYPGTFSSTRNAQKCSLCPHGTFGNRAGLSSSDCSGTCAVSNACPAGTSSPHESTSLSCTSNTARSLPSGLGLRLLPAAHQTNNEKIDLIVAPEETCKMMLSVQSCLGRQSVVIDETTRYVIGTAAELNMEPEEELVCSSST
jgi:hypothetical protein